MTETISPKKYFLLALLIAIFGSSARADTFIIDPTRSTIAFKVKGPIGKVKGRFERFEGQFTYAPNQLQQWTTTTTIETDSIMTGLHKRDSDLRKADFLDVKTYPTMTFSSTNAVQQLPEKAQLMGNLTLHGMTHSVVLILESVEALQDSSGHRRVHAVATTKIARKDYGVGATHGTFMVGDTIEIRLDIEGALKSIP